jgi:hypothetical protein
VSSSSNSSGPSTGDTPPSEPPTALVQPLRRLEHAITGYALQLVAAAHTNPELALTVCEALRPIAKRHRSEARHTAGCITCTQLEPEPQATPTTPIPFLG